jgi:hypothetical protein
MEPTELEVKVYGDAAILTGKLAVTAAGAVRHSRFRRCSFMGRAMVSR